MEQKSFWSKLLEILKSLSPLIKEYAPQLSKSLKALSLKIAARLLRGAATKALGKMILKLIGLSGGIYTYFVTKYLKKAWDYALDFVKKQAYIESVLNKAKEQLPKLEENKKDIPLDEKVKNESDFLNGTKP